MNDAVDPKNMEDAHLVPRREVPGVLWIALVCLGLMTVLTLIGSLAHPSMFVAVVLNCAIMFGLYRGHKWAYGLAIAFCLLGPPATLLLGNSLGNVLVGLLLNATVLVPVLVSTQHFFPEKKGRLPHRAGGLASKQDADPGH